MPDRRPILTRADLPADFTAETVRALPIETLRQLADHRNDILDRDEQRAFDKALHEVMRGTAERVAQRLSRTDWSSVRRDERADAQRRGRPATRTDKQLQRIAQRLGQQVDLAETLAPGVDWSFAQQSADPDTGTDTDTDADTDADTASTSGSVSSGDQQGTVNDLEQSIGEQVDLIEVMSEIADMSKRTYALEQQRDLQNTRSVFFGLVVSVAVLVAGWAPLVVAEDWNQRFWMIGLTVGTCLLAGAVYALVRNRQNRDQQADDSDSDGT